MIANGTPRFDSRDLRNAFGSFTTGVTIVTTRGADDVDVGLTANSFSSVSLTPPMVLWSLAETSSNIDVFRNSAHFAVHILSAGQEALSARFATKGIDRFVSARVERGPDAIPLLSDCMARFVCRKAYQYEGGDHVIFVGEILDFSHTKRAPLVFHGGRYGMLLQNDTVRPVVLDDTESGLSQDDLLDHLSAVYFMIRREAIVERHRRGWTDEGYAVLSILGRRTSLSPADIVALGAAHGRSITTATFADLSERGLVQADLPLTDTNEIRLTASGRQAVVEIVAILKASEANALKDLDPSEVHMLKQLLRRLRRQRQT